MVKSKLQAVVEETSTQNAPSMTTAVKSIANVLLGPRGKTPIDNIIQMQHYQLWGFILIVVGLLYIVWLMQKKLDGIDKQYKEQFVLLHRLFKSHQDLQVEVRKKSNAPTNNNPSATTATSTTATVPPVSLQVEEEDEIVFDEPQSDETDEVDGGHEVDEPEPEPCEEESVHSSVEEQEQEEADYEVFE